MTDCATLEGPKGKFSYYPDRDFDGGDVSGGCSAIGIR